MKKVTIIIRVDRTSERRDPWTAPDLENFSADISYNYESELKEKLTEIINLVARKAL